MAIPQFVATSEAIAEVLKAEYHQYLAAQDRHDTGAVESFLSPTCRQLARQNPAWNLASRDEIMAVLNSTRNLDENSPEVKRERGKVELRALTTDEKETLPEDLREQARIEGWEGLRVSLEDADPKGRRVEVRYYWRMETRTWVQCYHDLIWVGPKDPETENDIGSSIFGKK